jgi:release factor glutamine methyltransferase
MSNSNGDYYEPAEDTFFLLDVAKKQINKPNLDICEVGCGSGEIISNLKGNLYATDINPKAIEETKKKSKIADVRLGNLLEPFDKKFDVILFNTPYLPCEGREKYEDLEMIDKAIYGGKNGYEVILNFIEQIGNRLKTEGFVLMLFSSLSKPNIIYRKLDEEGFEYEILAVQKHFFEELYVVKVSKTNIIKKLENLGVKDIKYLAKGKHSVNYIGMYKNKKVVIKTGLEKYIRKEIFFLEKLSGLDFVPKIYLKEKEFVIREFASGKVINEWIKGKSIASVVKIFQIICDQCVKLDKTGISKDEMTNPYKHLFVDKNEVKWIDFERSTYSNTPRNLPQFLEYVKRIFKELKSAKVDEKGLFGFAKIYKEKCIKINLNFYIHKEVKKSAFIQNKK